MYQYYSISQSGKLRVEKIPRAGIRHLLGSLFPKGGRVTSGAVEEGGNIVLVIHSYDDGQEHVLSLLDETSDLAVELAVDGDLDTAKAAAALWAEQHREEEAAFVALLEEMATKS